MSISFKTDYDLLFIVIIFILSSLISYLYYRKSRLEGTSKKLFTLLRFLSTFFVLLLFASPAVSILKSITEKPVNIFLIDNSESLLLEDRSEKIVDAVKEKIENSLPGNSKNKFFLFSKGLYKEIEPGDISKNGLKFTDIDNFETNLTATLNSLNEISGNENLSTVTVISDGMINEGGSPVLAAKNLSVPVNYILIGDTIQKKDLVLRNVFFNKTAFIESNIPVNAELNSFEYERTIKINLFEEDKLIESKNLDISKNKTEYDLTFNVISNSEKIVKYRIEIEGLEDEITLKNNFQEFYIHFVNNKFKILVLAGSPSADFAFISEEIKKVKNFEPVFLTQKSANEFYGGSLPDLNDFDAFILIGYPTAITNLSILNEINSELEKNKSSLIFFASRNTDYKKLSILDAHLPFKNGTESGDEEQTSLSGVMNPDDDVFKNTEIITSVSSFPDVFKSASGFSANPSSETIILSSKNSEPAFLIQNTDRNKSAAMLVYGLYKWRLNNRQVNAAGLLNYLITTSVFAITDKEKKKSFTAETTKPVYSKFENVKFEAKLNDPEVQGGEQIRIKIDGNGVNQTINLNKSGNRFFDGEINIQLNGDYSFTAELFSNNNLIETFPGRFTVGENNFEYKFTRADNSILNLLSNNTSGNNFGSLSSSQTGDSIKSANEKSGYNYESLRNFELNINPYYLGIVILLLCLEWFFRKRNNLP